MRALVYGYEPRLHTGTNFFQNIAKLQKKIQQDTFFFFIEVLFLLLYYISPLDLGEDTL